MSSIWQKDILEYIPGWDRRLLPLKDISVFCRKLSFMLDAGISVERAMEMLSKQSQGRAKTTVDTVLAHVMRGDSFSTVLADTKVFPKLLCGLAAIGETAGRLPEVMGQAANYYEQRAETENELVGAVAYPAFVSVLMLAVMVMAVTFVLPSYARVFDASEVELPFLTQALLGFSNIFAAHWIIILAGLLLFILLSMIYLKSIGRMTVHGFLLRLSLYKRFVNVQLSQVLALILASGQNLTDALPMCAEVTQNIIIKKDLSLALTDVSAGVPLYVALGRMKYLDILLTDMARIGEETGTLSKTMYKCQKYFEQAYARGIKKLNKLIEPILTIILGVLLGVLMLAVILPTFKLADVGW